MGILIIAAGTVYQSTPHKVNHKERFTLNCGRTLRPEQGPLVPLSLDPPTPYVIDNLPCGPAVGKAHLAGEPPNQHGGGHRQRQDAAAGHSHPAGPTGKLVERPGLSNP